ncbi:MAG: ribonuclease P protein component [Pseudomonadota bacterium]
MYRFTRDCRLLKPADFSPVFDRQGGAQRSGDDLLTVLARCNGGDHARIGFAIGRRQVGRAVARNRIKRQAREWLRLNRETLPGLDFVVMARPAAEQAGKTDLRASLENNATKLVNRCAGCSSDR